MACLYHSTPRKRLERSTSPKDFKKTQREEDNPTFQKGRVAFRAKSSLFA